MWLKHSKFCCIYGYRHYYICIYIYIFFVASAAVHPYGGPTLSKLSSGCLFVADLDPGDHQRKCSMKCWPEQNSASKCGGGDGSHHTVIRLPKSHLGSPADTACWQLGRHFRGWEDYLAQDIWKGLQSAKDIATITSFPLLHE